MLHFPREALKISEAFWPQQLARRRLTKLISEFSALRVKLVGDQGAPKGRQQKGETGPGTHIFADFCIFSLIFASLYKSRYLGVADSRRKPQETAENRRFLQKPVSPICCLPFGALLGEFLALRVEKNQDLPPGLKSSSENGKLQVSRPTRPFLGPRSSVPWCFDFLGLF